MRYIIELDGVPHAFYLDKACAFGNDDRDQSSTQIGRALNDIGCDIILANSPQAKGKIERLWNTFQDRLIAELRLYNIKTIPQTNKFLHDDFIPRFNEKFGYPARNSIKAYMTLTRDLNNVFCIKEDRKISIGNTFSLDGKTYIVDGNRNYRFRKVNINTHYNGDITFDIMGKNISVKLYNTKSKKEAMAA